jgi:SAM-dependent methyltransferase
MQPDPQPVRGIRGYAQNAAVLIARYESLTFPYKHEAALHLLPSVPCAALDIGAGTGADASWLAAQGHRVVAVEPTNVFREFGVVHHRSSLIQWINDALPSLEQLSERKDEFGLVMLTAVWMHLDEQERRDAMPVVASLLASGGILVMALRHGPVPSERTLFQVSAHETVALAELNGLECILNVHERSRLAANREAGVSWTRLVFKRNPATPRYSFHT